MFYPYALFGIVIILFLLGPIVKYIWDAKKLRRFPNQNCLSGITNLAFVYEASKGFRSQVLHQTHVLHPVVRLGPKSLSFSSPTAIRDIYGHSSTCIKGDLYVLTAGNHKHILNVIDRHEHSRKRRYMSHAFATRNLENWVHKVADKVSRLVQGFDRICEESVTPGIAGTGSVDIRKWTNLFTIDAIADIALSSRLGCLERGNDEITIPTPDNEEIDTSFVACLHAGQRTAASIVWLTSCYKVLRTFLPHVSKIFRRQMHEANQWNVFIKHLVRERVHRYEQGQDLDDLVRFILEDRNGKGRGLDIGEIEAEVNILFDAGSDTTSIALTHVIYHLLRTPHVLERLREEVDEAVGMDNDKIATWDKVKSLPYLRACLDESLRLLPPLSMGLNRKTPPGGALIDGEWIPGNITVGVPAYTAHRNSQIFPDPERFWPERWLDHGSAELRTSFIPFSTGSRGCIGRNITYIEQSMLIATLVHRYSMVLTDPSWKLTHEEALNLWPGSLPVMIKRRVARL